MSEPTMDQALGGGRDRSRREVLRLLAGTAVAGSAVTLLGGCGDDRRPSAGRSTAGPSTSAAPRRPITSSPVPADQRMLVVIELGGGNDGLSTLVPDGQGRYHDARRSTALAEADLFDLGDGWALNRRLLGLHQAGLAIYDGVGAPSPSLSHFDMLARWWSGSARPGPALETGFLGRLSDQLGDGRDLTGLSIARIPSPGIRGLQGTTVGLPTDARLEALAGESPAAATGFRSCLQAMSAGSDAADGSLLQGQRASLARMLEVDEQVGRLPEATGSYPTTGGPAAAMAVQLSLASRLLRADSGVRIVSVPSSSIIFDTHDDHRTGHAAALDSVIPALEAFRADLAAHDLTDRVLIATTSEFGRRVRENGTGLDHGTASCALLMGPVEAGVHGEPASLKKLDRDGNLVATSSFDRYLATLAAWLDVDPAAVLASAPEPISGLLVS